MKKSDFLANKSLSTITGGKNNKYKHLNCPVGTVGAAVSGGLKFGPWGFAGGAVFGALTNC